MLVEVVSAGRFGDLESDHVSTGDNNSTLVKRIKYARESLVVLHKSESTTRKLINLTTMVRL